MTMPMLIINMGAEMIYVLDQRLKAQNIPREKSSKGQAVLFLFKSGKQKKNSEEQIF